MKLVEEADALYVDRLRKLEAMRAEEADPFAHTQFDQTHSTSDILGNFNDLDSQDVRIAGRSLGLRRMGGVAFSDLIDDGSKIQLMARRNALGEDAFKAFTEIDPGDLIGVSGTVLKTRTGEISISIQEFATLAKALRPPPEKWHGLRDVEIRYRQRYLDLIANDEVRELFVKRSLIIRAIRGFLDSRGFLEVETPVMHDIPGGALAKPFTTHHNALNIDLHLRVAPELYLKRLIIGGLNKVYEIGRNFRNEGIDTRHNPEFTMLEAYQAYVNYDAIMELTEQLIAHTAEQIFGQTHITFQNDEIDLAPPWKRQPLFEAVKEFTSIDFHTIRSNEESHRAARNLGIAVEPTDDRGRVIDAILKKSVLPKLTQPIFLTDYPVELSPLAKRKGEDPDLTERFQGFIGGLEVANAFSELNDPLDQRKRFEMQRRRREAGDQEAHLPDWDFVRALEYGMPPTGGLGIGIDRLVMLLCNQPSIREVILFPQMRPTNTE